MTRTWFTVCDTLGWIPHYSGRLPPWSLVCVCRSEFDKLEDELTAPFEPEGGGTYDPPTHRREAGPPYYHTPSNIDFCCCFFLFVGEWTGSINRYQYETFISIRHRQKGLGGNGTGYPIGSFGKGGCRFSHRGTERRASSCFLVVPSSSHVLPAQTRPIIELSKKLNTWQMEG